MYVRYSSGYNSRTAAARRARAARKRKAAWARKSSGSKALTLVKRLRDQVPRPDKYKYYYRCCRGIADYGVGTLNLDASESLRSMGMYWQIGDCLSTHPYGGRDSYWADHLPSTDKTATNQAVQFVEYRWPPRADASASLAFHPGVFGTPNFGGGTAVPGYIAMSGEPGGVAVPAVGTDYGEITGTTHRLDYIHLVGNIIMCPPQNSAGVTKADTDMSFKIGIDQVELYKGTRVVWLRLVVVQQFKDHKGEPDITPVDLYKTPYFTAEHSTDAFMTDQLAWLDKDLMSGVRASLPVDFDTGRDAPITQGTDPTAPAAPVGVGIQTKRSRNFKVLHQYQFRFSDTDLETRRLRSMRIDKKFYPQQRTIKVIQAPGDVPNDGTHDLFQMNPMFVFLIPSNSARTNVEAADTAPQLFENLTVCAQYRAD